MGVLLFQICVARHDLPGKTIEERVAKAWCDIQSHYHPYAPPIKELKAKTFRHGVGEGLSNVSLRAKAKETWDLWAGVHALTRSKSASAQEKHIAHHLDQIVQPRVCVCYVVMFNNINVICKQNLPTRP